MKTEKEEKRYTKAERQTEVETEPHKNKGKTRRLRRRENAMEVQRCTETSAMREEIREAKRWGQRLRKDRDENTQWAAVFHGGKNI